LDPFFDTFVIQPDFYQKVNYRCFVTTAVIGRRC